MSCTLNWWNLPIQIKEKLSVNLQYNWQRLPIELNVILREYEQNNNECYLEFIATVSGGLVTGVSEGTITISYTITVFGCSTTETYQVTINEPVEIGRFATTRAAIPGGSDSFYVEATGSGLTYQWFIFDGLDTFEINSFTSIDGEVYTGFTTNILTISDISENINGIQYFCVVSGLSPCVDATTEGAVYGSNPILNVGTTGISVHPQDQEDCEGEEVIFSVVDSGVPPISYQWQYDENDENWLSVPTGTLDGMTVTGETTNTLTISNILLVNSGYRFRCVLTGALNFANSDFGILTVNEC